MQPIKLGLVVSCVLLLAACSTSKPLNATRSDLNRSIRSVVGVSLVGARGKTAADDEKIDDTVAGLCGAGVWTKQECSLHDKRQ